MPAMRHAVDQETAGAANSLAAIVFERDRGLALVLEVFVQQVQHLEERHIRRNALHLIVSKRAGRFVALLPPDFECKVHGYL